MSDCYRELCEHCNAVAYLQYLAIYENILVQ